MTVLGADLRRADQRTNVRVNPFWITSAEINKDASGKIVSLVSFPLVLGAYYIHEMVFEVQKAFAGGTPLIDIGYCTLDDPSVDLTYSNYDADWFMANGEITATVEGYYAGGKITHNLVSATPAIGVSGTLWGMSKVADTNDGAAAGGGDITKRVIKGADTAMPCMTAEISAGLTDGAGRLHLMVSRII